MLTVSAFVVALGTLFPGLALAHHASGSMAAAHAPPLTGAALTHERRLRAIESAVLGPEHAAEHARLRAYERSPYWRAKLRRAAQRAKATTRLMVNGPPHQVGRWTDEFDIPIFAINSIVLPTGKVLWFAYPSNPDRPPGQRNFANAWLWDPSKGEGLSAFKQVNPPTDPATGMPVNIWCAGNSLLADGEVLVTGGNLKYFNAGQNSYEGLKHVYTFDPFTETWTQQPDMAHGRWYPSQLLMPDGRTFIMGGLDETGNGTKNQDLELFTPGTGPGDQGTISFLGPPGVLGDNGAPPIGDYYPHLFWMPNGRGLVAGPYTTDSWWFAPPGDPATLSWSDLPNSHRSRVWGTAVMVPGGPDGSTKVVQLGGSDKPAADAMGSPDALAASSAELFDEDNPLNGWQETTTGNPFALNEPRSHANTLLLPDGSMAEVGGGWGTTDNTTDSGAPGQWAADAFHKQIELWDPATQMWRLGPAQREFRAYHSTAVLLPDARIVSAGDDYNGRFGDDRDFTQDSAEIYEPPYLFDSNDNLAARPAITSAPSQIEPGQGFDITTGTNTPAATKAVLMGPGADTHAVDMSQRYVPLQVTGQATGRLSVLAPPSVNVAPPGYYMLFVLDANGTPSVAAWVQVVAHLPVSSPPATPAPPATTTPPPVAKKTLPRRPKVTAKLVRRSGRLRIRITLGKSSRARVKVRIVLRDRHKHTVRKLTATLRTGHTTTLNTRVPSRVRSIRASVL
jgi:galactose oxidase-like protein